MANGIYRKSRAELEALAADAADRKLWVIFNRLVAEISSRDRYDRDETARMQAAA